MKMTKTLVVLMTLAWGGNALAQGSAGSVNELLQRAKQYRVEADRTNKAREQEFINQRANQQQLLRDAKAQEAAENARSERLKNQFESNEAAITELEQTRDIRLGNLGELKGVVRQMAGDTKTLVENSLVSLEKPDRVSLINKLAAAEALPSINELDDLRILLLEEMAEAGRVVKFDTQITAADGTQQQAPVVRVGVFNAITDNNFLVVEDQKFRVLPRQPQNRFRSLAQGVANAQSGIVPMAVDPSRGQTLQLFVQKPSIKERINQGGLVGYVIIALGAFGLLIALERIFALVAAGGKVRGQLKNSTPKSNNALGRILGVYHENRDIDTETLELKLDEAILKETPALEKRQTAIKIIAAVAPLLGLLGTVTGMIETFQSITLFGTGDPKLMAGGISQALMTTVLGLVVAIPLVLLHSVVAGQSKAVIEVLEEQSAGLIAAHSEREL